MTGGRARSRANGKVASFPPVADARARVLILGSMPSERSLAARQYYAHPQNRFWPLMGALLGAGREHAYAARLRLLRARGVALWDVAHTCRRAASADATMTDVEPNDIAGLLARCPKIAAVFCNGRTAHTMFTRLVLPALGARGAALRVEYLPSTSPAHASISDAARLRRWRAVLRYARDDAVRSSSRAARSRPRP